MRAALLMTAGLVLMGAQVPAAEQPANSEIEQPCRAGIDRRSSDLCAQWKAADAAARSADAAWLFGYVGGGIGLLTLLAAGAAAFFARNAAIHTERGANAAGEAVERAIEANRLTIGFNQQQLRAYVGCEDSAINHGRFLDGSDAFARFWLRNRGQTPALEVRSVARAELATVSPERHKIYFRGKSRTEPANGVIWPSGANIQSFSLDLPSGAMTQVAAGRLYLIVAGIISYRDIFGKRHLSTFKLYYDPSQPGFDGDLPLSLCANGNNAN
jgi:hypothetical protein